MTLQQMNEHEFKEYDNLPFGKIHFSLLHYDERIDTSVLVYLSFLVDKYRLFMSSNKLRNGWFWLDSPSVYIELNTNKKRILKSKRLLKELGFIRTKKKYNKLTKSTKEYYFVDFRIINSTVDKANVVMHEKLNKKAERIRVSERETQNGSHGGTVVPKTGLTVNNGRKQIESTLKEKDEQKNLTKNLGEKNVTMRPKTGPTVRGSENPLGKQTESGLKEGLTCVRIGTKTKGSKNKDKKRKNIQKDKKIFSKNGASIYQNKKPTIAERNEKYLPLARQLSDIVSSTKNIKHTSMQLKSWANEIRRLDEDNGVSIARMKDALDWYAENVGGQYIPVIESGRSFREKFVKLEAAIDRQKSRPQNTYQRTQFSNRTGTSPDSALSKYLAKIEQKAEEESQKRFKERHKILN